MVKYFLLFFLIIGVNVMANGEPLADPTKPIDYKSRTVHREYRSVLPTLQSIFSEGKQRRAIINNKLYTTGQRVSGYLITQIKKDVVLLRYKNRSYKLALFTKDGSFVK